MFLNILKRKGEIIISDLDFWVRVRVLNFWLASDLDMNFLNPSDWDSDSDSGFGFRVW